MALLTVSDLSVGYESQAVISNLSFTVNPGDYLCIVGENGSGKTTLMKTILKLQKLKILAQCSKDVQIYKL